MHQPLLLLLLPVLLLLLLLLLLVPLPLLLLLPQQLQDTAEQENIVWRGLAKTGMTASSSNKESRSINTVTYCYTSDRHQDTAQHRHARG
jgi:hypothetical protein